MSYQFPGQMAGITALSLNVRFCLKLFQDILIVLIVSKLLIFGHSEEINKNIYLCNTDLADS